MNKGKRKARSYYAPAFLLLVLTTKGAVAN